MKTKAKTNNTNSYILMDDRASMMINMVPYIVDDTHPNYGEIIKALKAGAFNSIPDLMTMEKKLFVFTNVPNHGLDIKVDKATGIVTYKGKIVPGSVVSRIIKMIQGGHNAQPLVMFLDKLTTNPSRSVISELYQFLEYGNMPITPDGDFLAYKRVNMNYTSIHDSVTKNNIGRVVSMHRETVDSNSNNTCSSGLHFCSHEYLPSYPGDRIVIVKINPRDVVSIPADYNDTKGRACKYEIVGELNTEQQNIVNTGKKGIWDDVVVDVKVNTKVKSKGLDNMILLSLGFVDSQLYEISNSKYNNDSFYALGYSMGRELRTPTRKTLNFGNFGSNDRIADCIKGYCLGYVDGRYNKVCPVNNPTKAKTIGYKQGVIDGNGHKKRLFKDVAL